MCMASQTACLWHFCELLHREFCIFILCLLAPLHCCCLAVACIMVCMQTVYIGSHQCENLSIVTVTEY